MKKKVLKAFMTFLLINLSCSGLQITGPGLRKELLKSAESIKKDKSNIYKLDDRVIGKKGYFYILRSNGTISYHPRKALINVDFSRYPFVQKILNERNGCLSSNADGVHRFVFFREIDADEILCLTIESSEFDETVDQCNSNIKVK